MPLIELDKAKEAQAHIKEQFASDPIKLYKTCQDQKMSLSDYLEDLDPTPCDDANQPIVDVDAFERHLMVLDLKLNGPEQLTVAELGAQAEYLMPELILREIRSGMEVQAKYSYKDCIAASVPSKTTSYHPLYIPDLNLDSARTRRARSLGARSQSEQGGEFPVVSIRKREKTITVNDHGRTIEASYGVVRDYGFQDFAVLLRLVGAQLAADKLQDIYDLGITGDGTVGSASDTFNGTAGTLTYQDLVRNATQYSAPFVMSRILGPAQSVETILAMAQFQDPLSGWKFQKTGEMVTPIGAQLKQVSNTPGNDPTGTEIVTLDHRFAAKEVVTQELSVEADKIINRKFEQAVVSEESSFCVIADGALKRIVWT